MPKGRRAPASQSGRARFHVTSWVPRADARSHSIPGLQGSDGLPLIASEAPLEPMKPEVIVEPTVAMVCASCIVQDEATGITYMDMVTTSVG